MKALTTYQQDRADEIELIVMNDERLHLLAKECADSTLPMGNPEPARALLTKRLGRVCGYAATYIDNRPTTSATIAAAASEIAAYFVEATAFEKLEAELNACHA